MFDNMTNKKLPDEIESRPTRSIPMKFLVLCLVGLILFAGGLAFATGSQLLKNRNNGYDYYPDYHSTDGSRIMRTEGVIMAEIGALLFMSGLLSAGFLANGLDRQTRTALLGSSFGLMFLLLIFTLIFGLT